jgi:hypothetical protein
MLVRINTDNNSSKSQEFINGVSSYISEKVKRYAHQITRIEVYFTDENGQKESPNDKRCLLEFRLDNLPPMAVSKYASSHQAALEGALDKFAAAMKKKIGKLRAMQG